jgi:hypothetical protein
MKNFILTLEEQSCVLRRMFQLLGIYVTRSVKELSRRIVLCIDCAVTFYNT